MKLCGRFHEAACGQIPSLDSWPKIADNLLRTASRDSAQNREGSKRSLNKHWFYEAKIPARTRQT
jgi:hypothetical protein